ncbi:MAG: tRNA (cytidine(34)-2'-O)-methyltransferase [Pelagibacteraceae bacterium]|nr:MAG: tRNA (cytidine(34)-2'-O)-methyltransferase [alpha proteobacterium HIMB114]
MINIALYQPDIPQNTAAIIRTCSCLNIRLEIIKPTGFILNEKKLDRVYLDYLENCQIIYHESFEEFFETKNHENIILFTTKSKNRYYNHKFKKEDTLLFGNESRGVHQKVHDRIIYKLNIPINTETRSLNLASSVAIGASEALRQIHING